MRAVQAMNRICVLDVDLQGVRNIKTTDLRPIFISVQPPSMEVLVRARQGLHGGPAQDVGAEATQQPPDPRAVFQEQRLRQRNTETEESLAKRLAAARADMESSECGHQAPRVPCPSPTGPSHPTGVPSVARACSNLPLPQARSPACLT